MPTEQADRIAALEEELSAWKFHARQAVDLANLREMRANGAEFLLALMAAAAEPLEGLSAAEWKAEYLRRHDDACRMMDRAIAAEQRVGELAAGLRPFLPITTRETPDYAELYFGDHQTQAMTMDPASWIGLNALLTPPAPHSDGER